MERTGQVIHTEQTACPHDNLIGGQEDSANRSKQTGQQANETVDIYGDELCEAVLGAVQQLPAH